MLRNRSHIVADLFLKNLSQGEYNAELTSARMAALAKKYLPNNDWVLAEQDWSVLLFAYCLWYMS